MYTIKSNITIAVDDVIALAYTSQTQIIPLKNLYINPILWFYNQYKPSSTVHKKL